ncbi:MAG: hypothetical protein DHS20C16_35210 [Phycisphaerae bacterium]|nr:MAG: hypothetical protein DHS20C16_35210 [Phycisphaerae bacterium]
MVSLLRADAGEPLYFILLKLWIFLFGPGEIASASLSLVLSLLNIGLVFIFARSVFSDRVALLAALFFGFNWLEFHFSTHVRFYPLLTTVSILSYYSFVMALNKKRSIVWFALISLCGFHTHSYYWFICFSQFLVLLTFAKADIPRFILAGIPVAIAYAPWFFLVFLHQMTGYVSTYMKTNLEHVNGLTGAVLMLGASFPSKHSIPEWTGPIALCGAGVFLADAIRRRWNNIELSAERRTVAMFMLFYVGAVGTPILISITKPIYWMNHYDVALIPISAVLLAYLVSKLDFSRMARVAGAVLCVVIPALSMPYLRWELITKMDGDREGVRQLATDLSADDIIITTGLSYVQTNYYLELYELNFKALILYPPDLTPARPQYLGSRYKRDPAARDELPGYVAGLAEDLESSAFRRIYVFYKEDPVMEPLKKEFDSHFAVLGQIDVLQHPWGPFHDRILIYGRAPG